MDFKEYGDVVAAWVDRVYENRGKDAELTLKYCNDIIDYAQKKEDAKLLGFAFYYCGETYYCLNDVDNFFIVISKALSYLQCVKEWELVVKCYNYMGITSANRGNAPLALDYYLNGLMYGKRYQLWEEEATVLINIGSLHLNCHCYIEAVKYLKQARSILQDRTGLENYHAFMIGIYTNLAKCYTFLEQYIKAEEMFSIAKENHMSFAGEIDLSAVYCAEAIYFHRIQDEDARDLRIAAIREKASSNMAVMDIFDDYYDYALMLLDTDHTDAFWSTVDILEPLVKRSHIYNLYLRVISLKLKFYRKHHKSAEFLQAAGLYYELSELMDKDIAVMVNHVMNLRKSFEAVNRQRVEMEILNRRLLEKSEHDSLTKLANRSLLNQYSEKVFSAAAEEETTLMVEILDVDYFKEYNDNYGHQAGDQCLVGVADAIRQMTEECGGFCARYGGDEFIIIYKGISRECSVRYAEELKRRVMELNIEHRYSKALPIVTISQGICCDYPNEENRAWDFLHAADESLYRVKQLSRNNYCISSLSEENAVLIGTDS